jgi:8-oxo-dGTP pyrophosphatase MutT (NUDIX family)
VSSDPTPADGPDSPAPGRTVAPPESPEPPEQPRFKPSVTVAAVICQAGRYLLVEEHTPEGLRLNNPAGHLEQGESPLQAVQREALEETARPFEPEHLLGVYLARFQRPATGEDITYLRLAYAGRAGEPVPGRALDQGIVRTVWMSPEEVRASRARHRSPLVLRCIEDHLAGKRLPLDAVWADATLPEPPHGAGPIPA